MNINRIGIGLLFVGFVGVFLFAMVDPGWTAPWSHSCNGMEPCAVSTGALNSDSTDCDFQITGLSGDTSTKVFFQESFVNLPWCSCTDAGDAGSPLTVAAVPSATATLGSTQNVNITFPTGITAVVCHCTVN